MNHIHRLVWSHRRNAWVVANEHATARGKSSPSRRLGRTAAALLGTLSATLALANPVGPQVVHGTASFNQTANTLTVTNSANAIINWQSFSIGASETTKFLQPSASSAVLNRVLGTDPSQLLGQLQSNGRVFLVNPAGILVGPGARIDVGGLVASTLNLSNEDFLAGRLNVTSTLNAGSVVNQGNIATGSGGTVVLVGSNVSNEGLITTPQGQTVLAAGQSVQIGELGAPGLTVEIIGTDNNATNLGRIAADAGEIGVIGALVKNAGEISASSVERAGGRVFLRATKKLELTETSKVGADGTAGGEVIAIVSENGQISGELVARGEISAQGNGTLGSGGFVETSAAQVRIDDGFRVDTAGGKWLIDPTDFTIASGTNAQTTSGIGATTLQTALGSGSVTIQTDAGTSGNGDIFVNAPVSWSSANSLTLQAHRNIDVNANLTASGSGTINLHADDLTPDGVGAIQRGSAANIISQAAGTVTLRAGSGIAATVNGTSNILDAQTTSGSIVLDHGSGTLSINNPITLSNLTLSGGTLTGAGDLTLTGPFNVNGSSAELTGSGTLTTGGSTTVATTNGVLNLTGKSWTNTGILTVDGDWYILFSSGTNTLTNASGGTLNLSATNQFPFYKSGGTATLNNDGVLNANPGSTVVFANDGVTFNNAGTVNVIDAGLSFSGGGTNTGSFVIGTGRTLSLSGGPWNFNSGSNISGAGTVAVSGTVNVNTHLTISQPVVLYGGGTLGGTGNLTIAGPFSVTGGYNGTAATLSGSGTLTTSGATTVYMPDATNGYLNIDGKNWTNSGTLSIEDNDYVKFASGTSTLVNTSAGTIALWSSYSTPLDYVSGTHTVNNAGILNQKAGTHTIDSSITFTNTGTVNVDAGTLIVSGTFADNAGIIDVDAGTTFQKTTGFTNSGTLRGAGTISVGSYAVTNNGTIAPGTPSTPIGTLTVNGDFIQGSTGTLAVEIGGTNATQYDKLVVTNGNATLGGTLSASLVNGFTPISGQNFDVLTVSTAGKTASGSFTTSTLPSGVNGAIVSGTAYRLTHSGTVCGGVCWGGGGGTDYSWTTAANWTNDTLPGSGDIAYINLVAGVTVNLANSSQTIKGLNSDANNHLTIGTSGALTLNDAGTTSTLAGNLTINGGTLTVNGPSNVANLTLSSGTLVQSAGIAATVLTMNGGTWNTVSATLPSLNITDFRMSGGTFVRALGGDGSGSSPYQLADIYGVQGMASMPNTYYALANDIDDASVTTNWDSGAGFRPIGNSTTQFTGTFDGLGHTITGLTINRSTTDYVGLFAYVGGTGIVRNVGLANASVTGKSNVGTLAGYNYGAITQSHATGNVNGAHALGGLVGYNKSNGIISNSYATSSVTGYAGGTPGNGGLVGVNYGSISGSYATGSVTGQYSVGGLAGYNGYGSISNSYATGTVSGGGYVGGLVGYNIDGASVSYCYATGSVTGTSLVGGLIGYRSSGSITSSYWNIDTTGQTASAGGTGRTTAEMKQQAYFSGWNTSTWAIDAGSSYPYLRNNTQTPHPGATTCSVCTWDGDTNLYWSLAANWAGNLLPDSGATVTIGSGYGTILFDVNSLSLVSLATDSGFEIQAGKALTLTNAGSFNAGLTLGAAATLTAQGTLALSASPTLATAAKVDITQSGNGILTIGGQTYTVINSLGAAGSTTGTDLQGMNGGLSGKYVLGSNIDASATSGWNTGAGFAPVGNPTTPFTGTFDGLGHTITDLFINRPTVDSIGLFGYASGATILNVGLESSNVTGKNLVGGLVGNNSDGSTISHSYNSGAVSGSWNVGGLAGSNRHGTITDSYSVSSVNGTGDVGGLVPPYSHGTVVNSHYNVDSVLINGEHFVTVGGLYDAQYQDWFADKALNIADYSSTLNLNGGYYEIGTVQGMKDLLGFSDNSAYKFRLTTDINLTSAPGLHIPYLAAAEFDGNDHTLSNLVINQPFNSTIGMFGWVTAGTTIRNLGMVNTDITGGDWGVGAIAGVNKGTIDKSYATGTVTGDRGVGGLVGDNDNGTISNSFTSVSVSGDVEVGGLVGFNIGTINNSYSSGIVGGTEVVGGLVGSHDGTIVNSYSTGAVNGTGFAGGLIGYSTSGTITSSYWDKTVNSTPALDNGLGTGLTTSQMKQLASFDGWDISRTGGSGAIWRIYEGHTAPLLTSFLTPLTLNDAPDISVSYNGNVQSGASTAIDGVLGTAATGTNAGFYNGYYSNQQGYDLSGGNLTITQAAINTISMSGSRVYDGTNIVNAGIFTLSGLVNGETLTLSGAGTVANKNVGTDKPVALGSLALGDGTGSAGNYTFTGGTHVATITARPLTITLGTTAKTYDGNTSVAVLPAPTFGNAISADLANLALTGTGTYDTRHVATGKTVSYSALTLDGSAAGNYSLSGTTASGLGSITQLASVSWIGGASGDWFTAANWAGGALPDNDNVAAVVIPNTVATITSASALNLGSTSLTANSSNFTLDVTGGLNTGSGLVSAPAGSLSLITHSPLTVGSGGVSASTGIILQANTADAGSTIAINGPVSTASGSATVTAYGNIAQNANIVAPTVGMTSTTGNIALASNAVTVAGTSTYSASAGSISSSSANFGGSTPILTAATLIDTTPPPVQPPPPPPPVEPPPVVVIPTPPVEPPPVVVTPTPPVEPPPVVVTPTPPVEPPPVVVTPSPPVEPPLVVVIPPPPVEPPPVVVIPPPPAEPPPVVGESQQQVVSAITTAVNVAASTEPATTQGAATSSTPAGVPTALAAVMVSSPEIAAQTPSMTLPGGTIGGNAGHFGDTGAGTTVASADTPAAATNPDSGASRAEGSTEQANEERQNRNDNAPARRVQQCS